MLCSQYLKSKSRSVEETEVNIALCIGQDRWTLQILDTGNLVQHKETFYWDAFNQLGWLEANEVKPFIH